MSVIRVSKTRDYTVMSNYHLRDDRLSLKAVGLMSWMLSLPDNWNFTTEGIVKCRKEGRDAIRGALKELEDAGYLVIEYGHKADGKFSTSYTLYEQPKTVENKGKKAKPQRKNRSGKTALENPTQINTITTNTKQERAKELNEKENRNVDENGFPEENTPSSSISTKRYDFSILRKQIRKLLRENEVIDANDPEGSPLDAVCYKIVWYFLEKYQTELGKPHRVITNKALAKILDVILYGGDGNDLPAISVGIYEGGTFDDDFLENHYRDCASNYEAMIDKYFETDFNGAVDYGISHFFTAGIIRNRYYEVLL